MADLVKNRSYTPTKFWAGEFPVVTDTGTAEEAIGKYDLVMTGSADGKIKKATKTGIAGLLGIALDAAPSGSPVVYAMTGEVFADAVGVNDLTAAEAKAACRKLSIFLK